jgi:copper(I)-binding protein
MNKIIPLVITLFVLSCNLGGTPDIKVRGPKVVGSGDIAIFMLIINDGKGADALTGCHVPIYPKVKCEIDDSVKGMMHEVDEIEIPAGEVVALKRGSYHVMIFGVPDAFPEQFALELQFKKSGTKTVDVSL